MSKPLYFSGELCSMVGFSEAYTDSGDPFGKGFARLQRLPTDPERGGVPTPRPGGWRWAGTVLVLGWHGAGAGAGPAAVGSVAAPLPGLAAIAAPGGLARREHRSPLPPGAPRRAWGRGGPVQRAGGGAPGGTCQAVVLRAGWWGAGAHTRCSDSFFQEDYIPYPSIDEVGALDHPERRQAGAFPALPIAGERVERLFLRGAAQSTFPLPTFAALLFLGSTRPLLGGRGEALERG